MTEPVKAPRSALTLKFDAEQAMSIWLLAKFHEVNLDDGDALSDMIVQMADEELDEFRNPTQPASPDRHMIVQATKSVPIPTQPEKGGSNVP